MVDLQDRNYKPNFCEISEFVGNPSFDEFFDYLNRKYKPQCKIEYSGDNAASGWNIKLRKSGKALCVMYPKKNCFGVLVVIGKKEKERAEQLLPQLCEEIRSLYNTTKEGMGQRWLMTDIHATDSVYRDILKLVCLRVNQGDARFD